MLKAPFDLQVPSQRPRQEEDKILQEDHGPPASATFEGTLGKAFRRLRGDDTSLAGIVAGLPPRERRAARVALIRELGGGRAATVFERAFGSLEVGLPPAATGDDRAARDGRRRYEVARQEGLREVLLVAVRWGWSDHGALVEDLLAGAEPRLARGALTQLRDQREQGGSLFAALDRATGGAVSRADRRTLAAGPGGGGGGGGSPVTAALRPVAERRAVSIFRQATSGGRVRPEDPAVEEALRARGGGEPLPEWLRARFEARLGVDLSAVRIHADAVAARAAEAVSARAFTVGEDIFFAAGAFTPETRSGEALLVHELTHVRQALQGRIPTAAGSLEVSQPGDAVEREADAVATAPVPSEAAPVATTPRRAGSARTARPASPPAPRPGAFPILRNATDTASVSDLITASRTDSDALIEIGKALDATADQPADAEASVNIKGKTYNLTSDEVSKVRDAVNNALKKVNFEKIVAKAIETRSTSGEDKLWILDTAYWVQLFNARGGAANPGVLPGMGGTKNSGNQGFLSKYVQPVYENDVKAVPDKEGEFTPGGNKTKGVITFQSVYFLSRYVEHTWSNDKEGKPIKRDTPFKAVEVYKISADLYDRVEAKQKASRKAVAGSVRPDAVEALARAAASSGHPLPEALRRRFEATLGTNLGDVRIHTGDDSDRAASAIAARAYTVGKDIHFASGHFDPDSESGRELLAHEVAHTVQQGDGGSAHAGLEVSQPGDALEVEADRIAQVLTRQGATAAATAAGPIGQSPGSQGMLQRQPAEEAERQQKLRDDYDKALAADPKDFKLIGKLLNGFERSELLEKLAKLDRDTIAKIHEGALASVGPDSNAATVTRPYFNDKKIEENIAKDDWQEVARYMNGFNEPDMIARIKKLTPDQVQKLKAGAASYEAVQKSIDKATQQDPAKPAEGAKDAPPTEPALKKPRNRQEMIQVFGQPGTNLAPFNLRSGPNGKAQTWSCHKKVGPLIQAVLDKIFADGKSNHIKGCAGVYAPHEKVGPHDWGIAIDLNPQGNYGSSPDPSDKTKKVPNVTEDQEIIAPYFLAAGFSWGKDIKNPEADAMHFEYCELGAYNR